ncbi:hypothetical protein J2S28_003861 [Rhizobium sp. SLBN-94]|nr:hypothetical protein [Rhizobium sp. SLBN-94]
MRIRREDDQTGFAGKFVLGIKTQKRVQDRKRAIGHAKQRPGFTDRTIEFPFIDRFYLLVFLRGKLGREDAKRHRSPPKGRRYTCAVHVFHLSQGKRKSLTEKFDAKTLDYDSRK